MRRTADERVTLALIADEAQVSLSTISKVLNGRPDVSAATRERVDALLTAHGYQRRAAAEQNSRLIELVFHELESTWSMELIRGVENVATQAGASVVVTASGTRHAPGPEWIEGVLRRRPLGVVLVFSDLPPELRRKLKPRGIPFVILDPAGDASPEVPSVGSANWSGGLMATRHLIELGHRRIAAITGPEDMMCSRARVDGFRSAMAAADFPIPPGRIRYGDFHVSGGQSHGGELLEGPEPPTAIFAGSDLQALGVIEAARGLGVRVPQDLSVVGYDDLPLARWLNLTTVRQPLRDMAEEATRLVLRLSRGLLDSVPRIDLATSLVVRSSTGPVPDGA